MTVNPSAKAFIGLTETKAFIDRNGTVLTDTGSADLLQLIINAVCEALEGPKAVNGPILLATKTEYYHGGSREIILRRVPVIASEPFTVLEDGTALTPSADGSSKTAGGATPDFWLEPEVGIITRCGTWKAGRRIIAVTYTAGLGTRSGAGEAITSDVPGDLRLAAMIWVMATYAQNGASFSTHIGDGVVVRPVAMPPHVQALASRYHMPG